MSWIEQPGDGVVSTTNFILRGDGFFVSYNPKLGQSLIGKMLNWGSDDGGPETALIKEGEYFILSGDFRAEYEHLAPKGWEVCKQFFDQQSLLADSSWSTHNQRRKKQ